MWLKIFYFRSLFPSCILILYTSSTQGLCNGIIAILCKSIWDRSIIWMNMFYYTTDYHISLKDVIDFPLFKKSQVYFPKHLDVVMSVLILWSTGHNLLPTFVCSVCIYLEGKYKRTIFTTVWLCCHYMQLNIL